MSDDDVEAVALLQVSLATLLILAIALPWPLLSKLKTSDWAAWVQAVGSIAAVAGSAWIAGRQSREAEERATRDRDELRLSAAEIITYAARRIELIANGAERDLSANKPVSKALLGRLRLAGDQIDQFPLFRLADRRVTHIFIVTRDRIDLITRRCRSAERALEEDAPSRGKRLQETITFLHAQARKAHAYSDEMQARFGEVRFDEEDPSWTE